MKIVLRNFLRSENDIHAADTLESLIVGSRL
jgi:hypothetical protein